MKTSIQFCLLRLYGAERWCTSPFDFSCFSSLFTYDFWTQLTWPLYGKRLHLSESFLKFGWIILHRSVGSARRHPTAQQIKIQSQYSAQYLHEHSRVINQPPQRFTKVCLKLQNKPQPWFWQKKTLVLIKKAYRDAHHGVWLPWSSLAVSKDAGIISFKCCL